MIKLNTMLQLLDISEQRRRGLLAVEEPIEYVQLSRRDNAKRISPLKITFSIVGFSVNLDTSSFGLIYTHTQNMKLLGPASQAAM
jgi:hypothetical protein